MSRAVLLAAAALLCAVGYATAAGNTVQKTKPKYNIGGFGTTTVSGIMQTLAFAFRDLDQTSLVSYTITSSTSGQNSVLAGCNDFAGVNSFPTPAVLAGLPKFNSLLHSIDALLPVYYLPNITQQLVISQQALYDIWNNKTKWWDDPALVALNPGVNLPHERIRIIYRPDAAGTTVPWVLNLKSINSSYPVAVSTQPTASTWPFWQTGSPYVIPAIVSTSQTAGKLLNTPYSTGYLAQPYATQYNVPNFKMVNRAGNIVSPTSSTVESAIKYAVSPGATMFPAVRTYVNTLAMTTSPVGSLLECINSPVEDAWPIPEYNILLVPDNLHTDCFRALEMAQFLMWSINSDIARAAIVKLGAVAVPQAIADPILQVLVDSTCGLKAEYKIFDTVFPYENSIYAAAVVFAVFFWLMGIAVIVKRNHPAIKRVGVFTLLAASFSFGINFFTVLLWLGFPTQAACQARPWVSACSFVVIYGAIIYIFQDRIFHRLDIQKLIAETVGTDGSKDVHDVVSELSAASNTLTSATSSASGGSGTMGSYPSSAAGGSGAMGAYPSSAPGGATGASSARSAGSEIRNPKAVLTLRLILVTLLGLVNFLIPIIWVAVEPPTMQFRRCVGSFANTFRQAMLFYNILLIAVLCIGALTQRTRAQETSVPVHIMLLAAALFIPTNFLYTTGKSVTDIPDRSMIAIMLSPAVGILVSNIVSGLLVMLPPLVRSFVRSVEDELGALAIDAHVDEMKSRVKGSLTSAGSSASAGSQ